MVQILVVDDDETIRESLCFIIEETMGIEVEVAANGREAWSKFLQRHYEIVLTDIKMPQMDGIELLGKIKKNCADTIVIILTGYASLDTAIEAIRLGAYDYIEKPFSLEKIQVVLTRAREKIKLTQALKSSRDRLRRTNKRLIAHQKKLANLQEERVQSEKLDLFHRLSAFLVHELKTHIAVLSLVVQNSAKNIKNQTFIEETIEDIANQVEQLKTLTETFIFKNLPTEMGIKLEEININELVTQILDSFQIKTLFRINLDLDTDFRKIPPVRSDKRLLKVIFSNLIKNSLEAMPKGGKLSISSSTNCLKISQKTYPAIQISISDTGCGMAPDFITNHLYKPFKSTKDKGLGLGLYYTRTSIDMLKGTIDIKSCLNIGTTVVVTLPVDMRDLRRN